MSLTLSDEFNLNRMYSYIESLLSTHIKKIIISGHSITLTHDLNFISFLLPNLVRAAPNFQHLKYVEYETDLYYVAASKYSRNSLV